MDTLSGAAVGLAHLPESRPSCLIESFSNDSESWAVAGHHLTDTSLTDCSGGSEADTETSLRVELIHWEIGARAARPG